MFITKKHLPRRTFLRGLGATIALPLLDSMVPALTAQEATAAKPVRRLGIVYVPNGIYMPNFTPLEQGTGFTLPSILQPLAAYRDQMVVVTGLSNKMGDALPGEGAGDHARAAGAYLTGVHPKKTEGADIRNGITADQVAAAELGKLTVLPSIEMIASEIDLVLGGQCEAGYSCAYMNTISWRSPTTPLPVENNPSVVFERMFGEGGTKEERLDRMKKKRSVLDRVNGDLTRLQQTLGAGDRLRVTEYLESVREIERRVRTAEEQNAQSTMPVPDRPTGIPTRFDEHVRLLYDLQWLAYQADLTRVFTLMYGRELNSRPFPEIGLNEPHHGMSHHGDNPANIEKYSRVNVFHMEQFAYFLDKLRNTPDGDGTLLDNTMLLYGAGFSNPNVHRHINLPLVLAGGGAGTLKGGRHLSHKVSDDVPMTNLLVSMLDKVGVQMDQLGDSTGPLGDL